MKTIHKEECKRVFKNYDMSCARCQELANGAEARSGWNDDKIIANRVREQAIANHNCNTSNCGPVCTAFDW